jgi:hypothetical protein
MGATVQVGRDHGELNVTGFVPETGDQPAAGEVDEEPGGAESQAGPAGWYADAKRVSFIAAGELEGHYTLVLPNPSLAGGDDDAPYPWQGHGWGVVRVYPNGGVAMSGATGDGRIWSSGGRLRGNRTFLLYSSIAKTGKEVPGSLAGLVSFRADGAANDGSGKLHWLKPSSPLATWSELPRSQPMLLSRYIRPAMGALPLPAPGGIAEFRSSTKVMTDLRSGGLIQIRVQIPKVTTIRMNPTGFETDDAAPKAFPAKGTIRPRSGVFRGSMRDHGSDLWRPFKGVIFQKTGLGHGTFMGYGEAGAVTLSAPSLQ